MFRPSILGEVSARGTSPSAVIVPIVEFDRINGIRARISADFEGIFNGRALLCQGHGPFTELELRNGRAHRSCLYAGHARTIVRLLPRSPRFWVRVPIFNRLSRPEALRSSARYFEIRSGIPVDAFQGIWPLWDSRRASRGIL